MKVTVEPEHTDVPGFAAILMLTGSTGFTVIAIGFDVAGEPVAQVRLLVITQETTSPFVNAALLYVALFDPTFEPLSFH